VQLLDYFCRYMINQISSNMKKVLTLLLLTVFMASLLTGCKKKPGPKPDLPPAESMLMDFSNFESGKSASFSEFEKGVENSNWEFAVLVTGYFRIIVASTLVVPVAAFDVAIDQTPVWMEEEKTWQWSYSVSVASVTYKARLVGQVGASDVQWKMYVTREGTGAFAEFLWFTGTSKLNASSGQWILNESNTVQQPLLQIDWTKTSAGVGTVKYTYVKTGNFKNSYIEYGKTTGNFNSYFNINYYNGTAFSDMDVEWSSTGYNGRVMCASWFGDSNWHCWNSNLANIVCP
jgi:hypothetical protein